jgi:DNA end-binding protein Ku
MSARATASATVSFGLVSIPVKIYSTGETSGTISFNWLHKKCSNRVKQQYYCPVDDEVVGQEDLVKGYEFSKGQYVLFTEEELKAATAKSTEAIEITEFVEADQVDPIYFDKAYYLGPGKGGERSYKLLAEVMKQTGRSALGKYAARGKMYLVLLRPFENGLIMQQLHYAAELRPFAEVPLGEVEVKEMELKLAKQLVEQTASEEFKPESYHNEVNDRLREMIEQKVEGKEVQVVTAEEPKAQIIDLMEALKASLGKRAPEQAEAASARKGPKPAARAVAKKAASSKSSKR